MRRRQRRPSGVAVWVKYALALACAWMVWTTVAWAQQLEQPELRMADDDLQRAMADLGGLLLRPVHVRGLELAGYVEVQIISPDTGAWWLQTSDGCLAGRVGSGVFRAAVGTCDLNVHLDRQFADLRCDGEVLGFMDLADHQGVHHTGGLALVPTTRLAAHPARLGQAQRQCTEKSLSKLAKRGQTPGTYTVVDGIEITTRGLAPSPTRLAVVTTPEDCSKPAQTGDLDLLQRSRRQLVGRWWTPRHTEGVRLFASFAACSGAVSPRTAAGNSGP